jgi:tyrosine-protein phosphatase YwqE
MWIFNKKTAYYFADLVPDNFVDIHNHLLPGLDDGCKTALETADLIENFAKINIHKFIATPHNIESVWENDNEKINATFHELKVQLDSKLQDKILSWSSEYMLDTRFQKLLNENLITPLHANYILVEMSYLAAPINLYEILFDIQSMGYKPILAHPERYNFLHGNIKSYKKLKEVGCLFQLNLAAIGGYYGAHIKANTEALLAAQLYDFSGTDAHHKRHLDAIQKEFTTKQIDELKRILTANLAFNKL